MIFNPFHKKYKYEIPSNGNVFAVKAYTTIKYEVSNFDKAIFCFILLRELALDLALLDTLQVNEYNNTLSFDV